MTTATETGMTQQEFADRVGASTRTVRRRQAEGLPRNEDGTYPEEAVEWWEGITAERVSEHLLALEQVKVADGENPRKHFDEDALEELADSIRRDGLLQPVLVRPIGEESYELVSGERRLRAHRLLERQRILANVRQMDDATAIRVRLIENLQREDLQELEEASALRRMKDELEYTVQEIAEEIGKSVRYVYQRLKLLDVAEPVQEALARDHITASHAIEIARLPTPELQEAALEHAVDTRQVYRPDGGADETTSTISVRDLREWIRRELHLNLHAAPWQKDDPKLLPQAGPCTTCPKRTGNAQDLFPEIEEGDTCLDRDCYQRKMGAYVNRRWAQLKKAGEATDTEPVKLTRKNKWNRHAPDDALSPQQYRRITGTAHDGCDNEVPGLFVDGNEIGEVVQVCAASDCEVHASSGPERDPEEARRREFLEKNRGERGRRQNERSREIARRVLDREHWPGSEQLLRFAVVRLAGELHKNILKKALQHYVATREDLEPFWKDDTWGSTYRDWLGQLVADPDRCDVADLRHLLLLLTVAPHLNGDQGRHPDGFGEEDLAEAWGVDVEAVESEVREQGNWTLPEDLVELTWLTGPEPEDRWTRRLYHLARAGEGDPLCEAEVEDLRALPARPDRYHWRPCGGCQSALIDLQTSSEGDESEESTDDDSLEPVESDLPDGYQLLRRPGLLAGPANVKRYGVRTPSGELIRKNGSTTPFASPAVAASWAEARREEVEA